MDSGHHHRRSGVRTVRRRRRKDLDRDEEPLMVDIITVGEGEYSVQPLWSVYPYYEVSIQFWRADRYMPNLLLLAVGGILTILILYFQLFP